MSASVSAPASSSPSIAPVTRLSDELALRYTCEGDAAQPKLVNVSTTIAAISTKAKPTLAMIRPAVRSSRRRIRSSALGASCAGMVLGRGDLMAWSPRVGCGGAAAQTPGA